MLKGKVRRERRNRKEDDEKVGDGEGGNESLRRLSKVSILTW